MIKHHKIISLIIGLLFLVVVQSFATPVPIFRFLAPAFLIYLGIVWWYNGWYLNQLEKYNNWVMARLALLITGGFGLFLLIPSEALRGLFLIVFIVVVAAVEYFLGNFSENVAITETLIIAFSIFVSLAAYSQYFPSYIFLFVIAVFVAAFLLARSFYEFIPQGARVKIISSLALGLFSAELFWALSFLPLHYSALAVILFNVYYFALILNYYYLFNILTFKKIQFHLILILACSLAVLVATPWKIIT